VRFYALELYALNVQSDSVGVSLPDVNVSASPIPAAKGTYPSSPTEVITSHPNGVYDPGALNVTFDVLTIEEGLAGDNVFFITLEGVPFNQIKQNKNYVNYGLRFYAGMLPGLPLADNQPTPGLIAQGYVLEGIGNWVGEDMTLTFVCSPDVVKTGDPKIGNLVFVWNPGQSLAAALKAMLQTAYPGFTLSINIANNLVTTHTVTHIASDLHSFATWLKQYTKGLLEATYPGVRMYFSGGGGIVATDGTVKTSPIQLQYTDLIGQPVWADAATMDVYTVLRGDISCGDKIKLPAIEQSSPGLQFTVPSLNNAYQDYELSFKGEFQVINTRQIGDFRSSEGTNWCTVIRCAALTQQANQS
jgi:hypothetical protein